MFFKVIRAASDYSMVVVAASENENPQPTDPVLAYYVFNSNGQQHQQQDFAEVTRLEATMYFSGHADGMGFGKLPEKPFAWRHTLRAWRDLASAEHEVSVLEERSSAIDLSPDLRDLYAVDLADARKKMASAQAVADHYFPKQPTT